MDARPLAPENIAHATIGGILINGYRPIFALIFFINPRINKRGPLHISSELESPFRKSFSGGGKQFVFGSKESGRRIRLGS